MAKTGSDEKGDGSRGNPFRTINRAASALEPSDTVVVHGGVYREAVTLKVQGHPYVPEALMRFVAAEGEKVWIRGSDVFSAQWESVGEDVWRAPLPDGLFAAGSYNPFALDIDFNNAAPVRPGRADAVRGEFWIDGVCGLSRACGEPLSAVGDFHVTTDGRTVEMRFPQGRKPADCEIEISRRKQCFVSTFEGTAFYEVVGIDVGHAVEPGAFDGPRRRVVRRNAKSGITVQRDFAAPPSGLAYSIPFSGQIARLQDDTLVGAIFRSRITDRLTLDGFLCVEARSSSKGTAWTREDRLCAGKLVSYFYDRVDGLLYNFWAENGNEGQEAFVSGTWDVVLRVSADGGASWGEKTIIPAPGEVFFDMIRLQDGTLLLPSTRNIGEKYGVWSHTDFNTNLGRRENGRIVWTRGGTVHVEPEESDCGLSEPHVAQLADGRLVALLRSGSRLPTEENGVGGVTSGKLLTVSADNGMTWSKPRFLRFDDGKLVYSPRSFQDLFVSEKNGRLYAILNIADGPCWNCDPRNVLQIAEIDPKTLRIKRETVTEIERLHDQHHWMVRYSNWRGVQDAKGDVLIFLELALAEQSPIRRGYDRSMYCYRIVLPSDGCDWTDLNARARKAASVPIRPGGVDGAPFWNPKSRVFMNPPAFDFKEIAGAAKYRFTVIEKSDGKRAQCVLSRPTAALTPIWGSVRPGYVTVTCEGLSSDGEVLGVAGMRECYRAAIFKGPYLEGLCDYRQAAKRVYGAVFRLPHVQAWLTTGEPPKGYDLYCYPAKILSSIIRALCRHAKAVPQDRASALTLARKMADWLIAQSQPSDAPLANFPPTYWGEDQRRTAVRFRGQQMLLYPAHAANAYFDLAEETGEAKYREAALAIARTYVRIQAADGTWPCKVYEKDGQPVQANRLVPSRYAFRMFDIAYALTGDATFKVTADKAFDAILKGPCVTWNWDGQFEDIDPLPPYQNLQKGSAVDTANRLFAQKGDNALSRELVAWCEDQFVVWSDPIHHMDWKNWKMPTALEQYEYYTPIDASMGDMIGAYATAYAKTHDELYLAKARALADNITRHQRADGTIPTYFDSRGGSDWMNCMVYVADRLELLADVCDCDE